MSACHHLDCMVPAECTSLPTQRIANSARWDCNSGMVFNPGTSCSLVCSPGYSVSAGKASAICIDGVWSTVEATCVPSREQGRAGQGCLCVCVCVCVYVCVCACDDETVVAYCHIYRYCNQVRPGQLQSQQTSTGECGSIGQQ
jgi:hypothetical protein